MILEFISAEATLESSEMKKIAIIQGLFSKKLSFAAKRREEGSQR